jgi:hypothetical protein
MFLTCRILPTIILAVESLRLGRLFDIVNGKQASPRSGTGESRHRPGLPERIGVHRQDVVGVAVVEARRRRALAAGAECGEEGEEMLVGRMVARRLGRGAERVEQGGAVAARRRVGKPGGEGLGPGGIAARRPEYLAEIVRDAARADDEDVAMPQRRQRGADALVPARAAARNGGPSIRRFDKLTGYSG